MASIFAVDTATLTQFAPRIESELNRLILGEGPDTVRLAPMIALNRVFTDLFGAGRSIPERSKFLMFAAPYMRRVVLAGAASHMQLATLNLQRTDIEEWLTRLENTDSLCAAIVDLHYFAGLSPREAAHALGLPSAVALRELRFAKAWLLARLRWKPK